MGRLAPSVAVKLRRTTVTPAQSAYVRERPGFVPVECCGSIAPEANEIGGIFEDQKNARIEHGVWALDGICVERIFLGPPNNN